MVRLYYTCIQLAIRWSLMTVALLVSARDHSTSILPYLSNGRGESIENNDILCQASDFVCVPEYSSYETPNELDGA